MFFFKREKEKGIKRAFCVLLAFVLLFCLTACQSSEKAEGWQCPFCGNAATGNFCSNCGSEKVEGWQCPSCGNAAAGNFCSSCGCAYDAEEAASDTSPIQTQTTEPTPDADTSAASYTKGTTEGTYRIMSDLPELFTERRLTDEEVADLKNADLETLRSKISTPADFAAWIDTLDGSYNSNIVDGSGQRTYGADFCFPYLQGGLYGTPQVDSLGVRILGDDLPGIGQLAAVMDYDGGVILSAAVVPTDGGYYVYSLDYETQKAQNSMGMAERVPLIFTDNLESLTAFFGSAQDPSAPGGTLTQLFYFPKDEQVVLNPENGVYVCASGTAQELYRNEEYLGDWEERTYGHIKPENIGAYNLSTVLGGTTLTAEQAYALLDCTPEEVQKQVKTAGDVLMYMLAARIGDCGGDRSMNVDGHEWHYNMNAYEVMEEKLGNCGSSANLANFLLQDDYEEIGFILHAYRIGGGGGHVYNYIRYEGKYYIVDFSWYIFSNYQPSSDFIVPVLSSLEEYGQKVNEIYGNVCMVLAHTSSGQHLPNVFDDANRIYAVPKGADYTVLYQEKGEDCYQAGEYPLDQTKLDWTSFR